MYYESGLPDETLRYNLRNSGNAKWGNSYANPEPSLVKQEGVETRRQAREGRDSPDHKQRRLAMKIAVELHNAKCYGSSP